jgi:flavin-dependent dehydrogenase
MPPALLALDALGVERPPGFPFAGVRYLDGEHRAEGRFSMGPGLGVRRTALHTVLRARADALGVQHVQDRVETFACGPDWIEAVGIRARWMFAADGLQSQLRAHLGLSLPARLPKRLGARRHFATAPWSDLVEVYWSPLAEAYVTPVGPQLVGVAILFYPEAAPPGPESHYDRLLSLFPELRARLGEACTPVAGAGPFAQHLSARHKGRVLLVGDASGFVDPLTGEGIRLGLGSALTAVACIGENAPERYDQAWLRATRRYRWLTTGLLKIRARPWLRRRLVPTLARFPWLLRWALDSLNGP